jgi:hypothetical protein
LAFEALNRGGQPAGYRFAGSRWSPIYPSLTAGGCAGIKAFEAASSPPQQCLNLNALRTPRQDEIDAEVGFWLERPNVEHFRVLWNGEEAGRCETAASSCEVFLPLP